MKSILVDAGPLIALFDRDDKYHAIVISFLHKYKGRFITTWAVITEVSHMLSFSADVQIAFLEWLRRDALDIVSLEKNHLHRIIELSKKYSDVPMDLADSSLLVVSEMSGIKEIMTIDSDYYIYRIKGNKALKNVLSDYLN